MNQNMNCLRFFEMVRGASAYEVAVRNGFKGTEAEWIASLEQMAKQYEEGARQAEANAKASETNSATNASNAATSANNAANSADAAAKSAEDARKSAEDAEKYIYTAEHANWNAAEGEPGHVLNRTHYDTVGKGQLPETGSWVSNATASGEESWTFIFDKPLGLIAGKIYTVRFGETFYKCMATEQVVDGINCLIVSNANLGGMIPDEEVFSIWEYPEMKSAYFGNYWGTFSFLSTGEKTDFSITGDVIIPKKLPERFLPESVEGVVIRSSTKGSTKKFKLTVDDSGTITATEIT